MNEDVYTTQVRDIIREYETGEMSDDMDESGAGGFWDLAMEIAELSLPTEFKDRKDEDYTNRDIIATNIYNALLGAIKQ